MTLRPLVVVAIVLALASCARMAPPGDTRSPRDTGVDVIDNQVIVIDQEPIPVHGSNVAIKWRLDAGAGGEPGLCRLFKLGQAVQPRRCAGHFRNLRIQRSRYRGDLQLGQGRLEIGNPATDTALHAQRQHRFA